MWRTTRSAAVRAFPSRFQSTSSMWRTTGVYRCAAGRLSDFNPRPPCGGRPSCSTVRSTGLVFQSTSSMWRTTPSFGCLTCIFFISIHVLHVEDDPCPRLLQPYTRYFNPRPPCGGRRQRLAWSIMPVIFQSTSSVRRTTILLYSFRLGLRISIHVLRAEDDCRKFQYSL